MAYVHCRDCEFSQSDFQTENHTAMWDLEKTLGEMLKAGHLDDDLEGYDANFLEEFNIKTRRDFIIWEVGRVIKRLKSLHWATSEEYQNSDKKCPKCGGWTVVD